MFEKVTCEKEFSWSELDKILATVKQNSSLEQQQKFFGDALKNPLPISSVFYTSMPNVDMHYYQLLTPDHCKRYEAFEAWIQQLVPLNQQERSIGAVYNVTQSGKTKVSVLSLLFWFCFVFLVCEDLRKQKCDIFVFFFFLMCLVFLSLSLSKHDSSVSRSACDIQHC